MAFIHLRRIRHSRSPTIRSRWAQISGLLGSLPLRPVELLASLGGSTGSPPATETFTPGLPTTRSPSSSPGMSTVVAGQLHRRDSHPLEQQLASLHPRSLGNPRAYMPCSSTPARSRCPAHPAPRCSLPRSQRRRLSQRSDLRGSIPRPARSLCTLRSRDRSRTTQHSVPAGGQPLPGGVRPRRVPPKVSAITNRPWLPPPPGFPGALTSPAG